MPRTQTPAHERAAQRATAQERASMIAGRPVAQREAAAILRGDDPSATGTSTTTGPIPSTRRRPPTRAALTDTIPTPDRVIDLDGELTEPLGRLIARVQDMRILRGSTVAFSLVTSTEYMNTATRAALIGGDLLVADLTRLRRWPAEDDKQTDVGQAGDE